MQIQIHIEIDTHAETHTDADTVTDADVAQVINANEGLPLHGFELQ